MQTTRTLAIIKPDAVEYGRVGRIFDRIEEDGRLNIRGLKWEHLTEARAKAFYAEHDGRDYFEKLVKFMTSGPCIAVWLESISGTTDAVVRWRGILKDVRAKFPSAYSERNSVHGSDSAESAARELAFFGFGEKVTSVEGWDA